MVGISTIASVTSASTSIVALIGFVDEHRTAPDDERTAQVFLHQRAQNESEQTFGCSDFDST